LPALPLFFGAVGLAPAPVTMRATEPFPGVGDCGQCQKRCRDGFEK
jgi:hypothetical protein